MPNKLRLTYFWQPLFVLWTGHVWTYQKMKMKFQDNYVHKTSENNHHMSSLLATLELQKSCLHHNVFHLREKNNCLKRFLRDFLKKHFPINPVFMTFMSIVTEALLGWWIAILRENQDLVFVLHGSLLRFGLVSTHSGQLFNSQPHLKRDSNISGLSDKPNCLI